MSDNQGAVEAAIAVSNRPDSLSLRDQLRAARSRAERRSTRDLEIPGYEGRLWGTFRVLEEYKQIRDIGRRVEKIADETDQELAIAADIIVESCTGIYAKLPDGEKQPLEQGLGAALAQFLFEPDPAITSDRQGIYMLFPSTLSVAVFYSELSQWFAHESSSLDAETSGNSEAPSS